MPDSLLDDGLTALQAEPEFVAAFLRLVGVDVPPPRSFKSAIPGRERFTARIIEREGRFLYLEESGGPERAYLITTVFASWIAGRLVFPQKPELARWTRRVVAEGDLVTLPQLQIAPLPPVPPAVERVHRSIVLLVRLRLLVGDEDDFALNRYFLARWTGGIDPWDALAARGVLERLGRIERTRTGPPVKREHPTQYWRFIV